MDFKKKAGLALALAAIFTTGGANLALAVDNATADDGGSIVAVPDSPNLVVGDAATTTNKTLTADLAASTTVDVAGGQIIAANKTGDATSLKISGAAVATSIIDVAGGGEAFAVNSSGESIDLIVDKATLNLAGSGTLDAALSLTTGAVANVTGDYTLDRLVSDSTSTIVTVGNATKAGELGVDVAALNGAKVFADPAFTPNTYGPSQVTLNAWGSTQAPTNRIDGLLVAGENSTITIGANNSNLVNRAIEDTKKWAAFLPSTAARYTAAMAFVGPHAIQNGGVWVDGTATSGDGAANTANFFDNSLTVFDLTGVSKTTAALSAHDGTKTVVLTTANIGETAAGAASINDAGVYFHNAHVTNAGNPAYTIIGNATTINVGGIALTDANYATVLNGQDHWTGNDDDLHFSSSLLNGAWSVTKDTSGGALGGTYNLVLTVSRDGDVEVQDLYPAMSNGMAGMVDDIYTAGANASFWGDSDLVGETDNAGILFVSRATDNDFLGEEFATEAAATIEGAAQIAVAAGVPAVTNNVISKIGSLIVDHNNLLNATQPAYGNEPGSFGIWANPFYATSDVDGMDAGRFENGYEMNYGGAAFGIDYNINEAFRLGLALNVGGGDTESEGDFNKTEADFDFFGVSLYGSYTNGAFGLTGDLGFTGVDSEIDQNIPGALGMGRLESDVDSNAFTLGLTGQYRFAASDNLNITPHLGLRYTKISTDDADVNSVGFGRVFDVETEDQNLFQIPLGVEFSSNIATDGGWTITPSADLGVLFTAGDTDIESRVRIPGTTLGGATTSDANDSAAFQGRLGIKAAADNGLSLGLDYGILASGNQTDHQFSGMLRFEF